MEQPKCREALEIEELRNSIGAFPFEDPKYNLSFFSREELYQMTDDFSENNLIGSFQFGKVYRGFNDKQALTVKKWEQPLHEDDPYYCEGENEMRQINEVIFLKQAKVSCHPNLVKLIGYCCEGDDRLFMVYDLNPFNSVHNLVLEDSFTWLQRVKVFLGFAHLVNLLHSADHSTSPYLIRNIDAAHILVDKDYNPFLCDFSMITGGIFPNWEEYPNEYLSGCYGYTSMPHHNRYPWKEADDVFAFGTLILMLISKRVYPVEDMGNLTTPTVHEWARRKFESTVHNALGFNKISLVHRNLLENHGYDTVDGLEITKLAVSCISRYRSRRPSMEQVMKILLKLRVVQNHPDFFGLDRLNKVAIFLSDK